MDGYLASASFGVLTVRSLGLIDPRLHFTYYRSTDRFSSLNSQTLNCQQKIHSYRSIGATQNHTFFSSLQSTHLKSSGIGNTVTGPVGLSLCVCKPGAQEKKEVHRVHFLGPPVQPDSPASHGARLASRYIASTHGSSCCAGAFLLHRGTACDDELGSGAS